MSEPFIGPCGRDCNANQGRERCEGCDEIMLPLSHWERWQFVFVVALGLCLFGMLGSCIFGGGE